MSTRPYHIFLFSALFVILSSSLPAQQGSYEVEEYDEYDEADYQYDEEEEYYQYIPPEDKTQLTPLPPETHRELIEDLDYNATPEQRKKIKEERKKTEDSNNWLGDFFDGISFGNINLGPVGNMIVIVLLLAGLGYFIYQFLDTPTTYRSQTERDAARVDISEIEEEKLTLAETESLLGRAERNEQFELAIRLQYLALLKRLHEQDFIQFAKDKINRAYLREMEAYPELSKGFRRLTHNFERNWYGKYPIDPLTYRLISDTYVDFHQSLDRHQKTTANAL